MELQAFREILGEVVDDAASYASFVSHPAFVAAGLCVRNAASVDFAMQSLDFATQAGVRFA
jgi:hypothetical protein